VGAQLNHRVAIVGYGTMGDYHHRKLAALPGVDVVGVVDIDPRALTDAAAEGLRPYADLAEALADPSVDFVLISTPNDAHHDIAVASLRAGKNVLCEKPAMVTSAELIDVVAEAERAGRLFMVHQNRRWDPDFLSVKEVYDSRLLGQVTHIESRVHGSRGIPGDWRTEKAAGGGMLLDWGVHLVDRLLLMVDSPVTEVFAELSFTLGHDVDDGFEAWFRFANGVTAVVDVSTTSFYPAPLWTLRANRGGAQILNWRTPGEALRLGEVEEADATPILAGTGMTKTMAPRVKDYSRQHRLDDSVETLQLPVVEADVSDFYRNAFAVVDEGAAPVVTNAEILRTLRLLEACVASHERREVVHFEQAG
jgi:scyllo-inositol 2-dehydrogenase (NADP+)